jgi:hypothetical protein
MYIVRTSKGGTSIISETGTRVDIIDENASRKRELLRVISTVVVYVPYVQTRTAAGDGGADSCSLVQVLNVP